MVIWLSGVIIGTPGNLTEPWRDVKLATSRVEGYRNFATKLWNAARFCEMNGCRPTPDFDPTGLRLTFNRWIVGELAKASAQVTLAIEAYKFNEAANAVYHFTWGTFCDWYLEVIKPTLRDGAELERDETRATAAWALDRILQLLHPFMPFITEELWEQTGPRAEPMLALSSWPRAADFPVDAEAGAEMNWTIRLVEAVRSVRAEMNVPAGARIEMRVNGANAESKRRLDVHADTIATLARVGEVKLDGGMPAGSVQIVLDEAAIVLPLAGVIDVEQEKARLSREFDKMVAEIGKIENKLANEQFVAKAPAHVIETQRERRADAEARRAKLAEALARLTA